MLYPPEGIGEFRGPVRKQVVPGGAATLLVPASASRVLLLVCNSTVTGPAVVTISPLVSASLGIELPVQSPLIEITWFTHGPLVNAEWWAFAVAGINIEVIELFYEPHSLRVNPYGNTPETGVPG